MGKGFVGPQQKTNVIDHQSQAPFALHIGPTNPPISIFEVLGRRRKDQRSQPFTLGAGDDIIEPFSNRLNAPKIVMLLESLVALFQLR